MRNGHKTGLFVLVLLLFSTGIYAESIEETLEGFSEENSVGSMKQRDSLEEEKVLENTQEMGQEGLLSAFDDENITEIDEDNDKMLEGLSGKWTQFISYAYYGNKPHQGITSFRTSLLLDYEHKFENHWRFKINAKAYYDSIYKIRNQFYSQDELNQFQSELRLYDAYIEGSLQENIDFKLGRQVVVWGRSDTIRITDILNPLDNRRPGIVDIEDLRLPVTMAKIDWFIGDWRITPIAILEQQYSLNPPFGSAFNPMKNPHITEKNDKDISYALSIGGEFSGWDMNFYAARIRDDLGYIDFSKQQPLLVHDKVNMLGTALNILSGSWLYKAELAYFNGLKFTSTQNKNFQRTDLLLGVEYKGIADTLFSYDISLRHFNSYDTKLLHEPNPLEQDTYQHAFRVSSDFMNATLTANYLISLFGKNLDQGGFQRFWVKYELADGVYSNAGIVDYIGGSKLFDQVKNSDMFFIDISYSF